MKKRLMVLNHEVVFDADVIMLSSDDVITMLSSVQAY